MDTGTKVYRNYFPIKFGWQAAIKYGTCYPVFRKLLYPGDVFKIHADLLIRYQPMLSPPMNDTIATVRFAFLPLRLLEEDIEFIITGSKDGHLTEDTIPVCDSCFKYLTLADSHNTAEKNSELDFLYGLPPGLALNAPGMLTKLDNDKASPALYFSKAFHRFWWDYYRDENLYTSYSDFDDYFDAVKTTLNVADKLPSVCIKKDRITSATPWQLKANVAPTIEVGITGTMTPNYTGDWVTPGVADPVPAYQITGYNGSQTTPFGQWVNSGEGQQQNIQEAGEVNSRIKALLNQQQTFSATGLGFDAAALRAMMSQTRIFERLARTGSRYTEYLRANFGIAPSDGTLQRAQYLGGFKTHIVTTEVVQSAGAVNSSGNQTPVGTLRGHGITHGNSTIKTFMAYEPGIIIGILDVKPETIYSQGVDRELTCRSRFDFLNPSFQHLSEQEVRKGEVFFGVDTDVSGNLVNSATWGFQPYAQELRTGTKHVYGEMRDTLSYWTQALIFSSRPSLNNAFVSAATHLTSYNRPFAVNSNEAYPMVVDFGGIIEAYRPLVKNGTPGLVDHN